MMQDHCIRTRKNRKMRNC